MKLDDMIHLFFFLCEADLDLKPQAKPLDLLALPKDDSTINALAQV